MKGLKEKYTKEIAPKLKEMFGYKNVMAIPRIEKVVVNIGAGRALKDAKYLEIMGDTVKKITGQKPVFTRARKSISNFKIKEGMKIGIMVTLRGQKMYDFIEKFTRIVLPRIRDFRGLPVKSIDKTGNVSIGIKEHTVFPEIEADEVDQLHGLEVVIKTTAHSNKEGTELLKLMGFPFVK